MRQNRHQIARMLEGAAIYAKSDKSDPFAFARAKSHVLNGVASIEGDRDMFYSAEQFSEQRRSADGEAYTVTAYRNISRP